MALSSNITTDPSSVLESPRTGAGPMAAVWKPGGLIYLVACVLGLLVGLFVHSIFPPRYTQAAPLPTLSALAVAQGLFILLGWPLLCLWRTQHATTRRFAAESVVEAVAWTLWALPLLIAATWLANATVADAIRTALAVAALWPLAIAAGSLMRARPSLRPAVMLTLLVLAALPALWYVWREFLRAMPADWLWNLAPATNLWQAGAARQSNILPTPAWPQIAWFAAAAATWTLAAMGRGRPEGPAALGRG